MQTKESPLTGGKRLRGIWGESSPGYPLVTVITAVFNGDAHLAECLDSVLRQDYPNIEHIVIDGGSTDGTLEILRGYSNKIAFWKSESDKGVYDAWNKGLKEARGDWICFLGADDQFLSGAVNSYMRLATQHPDAEYLSSIQRWIHPSGYERIRGKPWSWRTFRRWGDVAHVGSMHHRRLFNRVGFYDLSFGITADYELLLRDRALLKTAFMPDITVLMRGGGMSDGRAALTDATRAKITTGGRNPLTANLELLLANIKYLFRPLRRAMGKFLARLTKHRAQWPQLS